MQKIESRVSRTGSITINRRDAPSASASAAAVDGDGNDYFAHAAAATDGGADYAYERGYRKAAAAGSVSGHGGGVSDTLLNLRESGREFERRQQQLDEDLERLSLRLAETAAAHASPPPPARQRRASRG